MNRFSGAGDVTSADKSEWCLFDKQLPHMNIRIFSLGIILVLWLGTGLLLEGQDSTKERTDGPLSLQPGVPRLFEGMGPYRRKFSTRNPQAQKFLNQGMVWIQGFNHDEARRSFLKAAELDSGCAWAWWGVAYCEGPNYNDPAPDQNRSRAGWYAIQNALARLKGASELEKDLVLALQQRFSHPVARPRAELDRSYADAMAKVWKKYPEDADVGALYAEARMQLRPWALYRKSRQPQEGTLEIREVLEKVMQLDPDHA